MRQQTQAGENPTPGLIGQYAGFVSRLLAFLIDVILLGITVIVVSWFTNVSLDMLQIRPIMNLIKSYAGLQPMLELISSPITAGLISFGFIVAYHIFFWVSAGQTPGKALLGIRVIPLHGGKITIWRALVRYVSYYLSGILFGIGFLWIIIDDRRMGLHDKLSGTCVIYVWDARPDETFLTYATKMFRARHEAALEIQKQRKRLKRIVSPEKKPQSDDDSIQSK